MHDVSTIYCTLHFLLARLFSSLLFDRIDTAMADEERTMPRVSEEEPLLGDRGDGSLPVGEPLYKNLILGKPF